MVKVFFCALRAQLSCGLLAGYTVFTMKREVDGAMKKVKVSLSELIRKNKEELLKDKKQLERIEKRIDEKYVNAK
ncbi:FbpB family small basic protein [Ectobacillus funiculus]|uniref:FbpB family small basic protein n=1 Tax=Ectobacillus funiculus TaxID=137993 RepID=UPI00319E7F12